MGGVRLVAALLVWVDHEGCRIVLEESIWTTKICVAHPELRNQPVAIEITLSCSELVTYGKDNESRGQLYRPKVLPPPCHRTYLKVVVSFAKSPQVGDNEGFVVTAYPTNRIYPKERQRWP